MILESQFYSVLLLVCFLREGFLACFVLFSFVFWFFLVLFFFIGMLENIACIFPKEFQIVQMWENFSDN